MIAIIDGCGANIASIQFALDRLGLNSVLTTSPKVIQDASHVILPGVGTASHAMQALNQHQLVDVIRNLTQPVLGICLGMQLLFEYSKEDGTQCLNVLPGQIKPLEQQTGMTIPHMGWNQLAITVQDHPLTNDIPDRSHVYFVHSYAADVSEKTVASTTHSNSFSAIVAKGNFYGMQFHPERSGLIGEQLLLNFTRIK